MPIGLVTDIDFERELSSYSNGRESKELNIRIPKSGSIESVNPADRTLYDSLHPKPVIIDSPNRGRSVGDNNVPDSLRKIIGETAVIDGRSAALNLAKDFGISPSSVSAYAKGSTSTTSYHEPKSDIISHINKSRARASKKAGAVLRSALEAISQEKLDYTDAKDLSVIAKNMSAVIKDLEPPSDPSVDSGKSAPQFVIYAPQFRQENSFDVIRVTE